MPVNSKTSYTKFSRDICPSNGESVGTVEVAFRGRITLYRLSFSSKALSIGSQIDYNRHVRYHGIGSSSSLVGAVAAYPGPPAGAVVGTALELPAGAVDKRRADSLQRLSRS